MPDEKIDLAPATPPKKKSHWLLRMTLAALLFLGAAVGLGYYAWNVRADRNAKASKLVDIEKKSIQCTGDLNTKTLAAKKLQEDLDTCNAARGEQKHIAKDLDTTRKELAELRKQREQTAKRLAAFKEMTAKFRKMIDSGKLNVQVREGRMVVKLPAGVLFPSGSAELSRDGELALMEVAVILRQFKDRRFMIIGHTDSRRLEASPKSRYQDNWDLSAARAVRVTRFLIEAKMNPKNLLAAGHAQFDPVSTNATRQGRQENRRIEIVLLPNIEEMPGLPDSLNEKGK